MDRLFTGIAQRIAGFVGQPVAFIGALSLILVWAASGLAFGFSNTWQLVVNSMTTIVTFLIVFLIQNSQNRDAAAMQAKLDELIRSVEGARNQFIGIEHRTENEVNAIRAALEAECDPDDPGVASHETVERLLMRL